MSRSAEIKRRNVDPQVAHERAVKAATAANAPGGLITRIERAKERFTPEDWARLAAMIPPVND